MSNSSIATAPDNSADPSADLLIGVFTSQLGDTADSTTSEMVIADRVHLQAGIDPSYAQIILPMNGFGAGAWDESAFSVAFKKTGLGRIKLRGRATIFMLTAGARKAVTLLTGTIVNIDHGAQDVGIITVLDDRFLLSKVTVTGQAQFDPVNLLYGFCHNAPCIFNENGHPNCIDFELARSALGNGTVPVFAPTSRFGWKSTDYAEPKPGKATDRARSWRVQDALAYLRMMHYDDANLAGVSTGQRLRPTVQQIRGYVVDAGLIWPDGIEELFNGAVSGTSRVLKHTKLEGLTLDAALTKVAQRAGPYELLPRASATNLSSGGTGGVKDTSILSFVDMRGRSGAAQAIIPALYGFTIGQAMQAGGAIWSGNWTESIMDYHDGANIVGDAPVYEAVFSTQSDDTLGGGYLEPAWSDEDEAAFQDYIKTHGKSSTAFLQAAQMYPLVYAAWRVSRDYINLFRNNAKWANLVTPVRAHPKIRPCLITSYNQNTAGDNPSINSPREIVVEYRDFTAHWRTGGMYDNLKLSQDGQYFMLEPLRDQRLTWTNTGSSNPYDPTGGGMHANDMRATLAIELDFRIVSSVGVNSDKDTEALVAARVATPNAQPFYFTYIADDYDYVDWNRFHSRPVGQIIPAAFSSTPYPDKCSEGASGNLFTDKPSIDDAEGGRLFEHAQARASDVRRVGGKAEIKFKRFSLGFMPGNGIKEVDGAEIPFRGVITSATFSQDSQEMHICIGVAAPSDITRGE
jgi:hypothetical protein